MRHHKKIRTLGRKTGQREALLRSLTRSLIIHDGITTTLARAKEMRPFVERLVSASKKNTIISRRNASSRLGGGSTEAVKRLHDVIAPRYQNRHGGYTRVVRLTRAGKRVIDSARIEFV